MCAPLLLPHTTPAAVWVRCWGKKLYSYMEYERYTSTILSTTGLEERRGKKVGKKILDDFFFRPFSSYHLM